MRNLQKHGMKIRSGAQEGAPAAVRILLADDHAIVRQGLCALLENEPRFSVVGEVGDGRMAVEQAVQLIPDVVVMDISMPGLNGVDATCQIKTQAPQVRVIALSMHSQKGLVKRMLQAGARGFLLKDCAGKELVAAIHSVMANQFFFSATIAESVGEEFRRAALPLSEDGIAGLNLQQRELLQLLAEGKNTKQIAERLRLSPKTVDVYRRRLMDKLQLWSIAELTKYAIREGVTSLDA